jgi:hypothetical protein
LTIVQAPDQTCAEVVVSPARPQLKAIVARTGASLATSVFAPAVLFFRHLTLLWGVVIAIKGTITLWLLLSLSTVDFVLVKSSAIIALTLLATAATVVLSAVVGRREGLLVG